MHVAYASDLPLRDASNNTQRQINNELPTLFIAQEALPKTLVRTCVTLTRMVPPAPSGANLFYIMALALPRPTLRATLSHDVCPENQRERGRLARSPHAANMWVLYVSSYSAMAFGSIACKSAATYVYSAPLSANGNGMASICAKRLAPGRMAL